MKYPGLPPAGSGAPESGWAHAGANLSRAAALLQREAGPFAQVQLAEVLRRSFEIDAALRALVEPKAVDATRPLALLCEGIVRWTAGDAAGAVPVIEEAQQTWDRKGDAAGALAAAVGLARCARLTYRREFRTVLEAAVTLASGMDDVHLLADLDRERAAWALLAGEHDEALERARAAGAVHRDAGDDYLAALADVLVARALNATHDTPAAVELMQEQVAVAERIGSTDLEQVALVYLGQFLQRGVTPDSPQWSRAEDVLARALDRAGDPFTRAELLLPLAQLHTTSGDFDRAAAELDEYGRIYLFLGGNQISDANLIKARARLALARQGGIPTRGLRRSPRGIKALLVASNELRQAARAYRRAGLEPGRENVRWHISLIDVLATGRGLGSMPPGRSGDALDSARDQLLAAEIHRCAGRTDDAAAAYAAAERHAVDAGSTMLAVAAASGSAEVAWALGRPAAALAALRDTVEHSERIRAAILTGAARGNIAAILRSHYERALLLAARLGDGGLALELVERLRTDRLAGLLRRAGGALPTDLAELLARLDDVNAALVSLEPGIRSVRTTRSVQQLAGTGARQLLRDRAELHEQLASRTTELFADTYGAEPVRPQHLATLRDDVLVVVPLCVDDEEVVVSLWRSGGDRTTVVAVVPMGPELLQLREVLTDRRDIGRDRRIRLTCKDLVSAMPLLPSALRTTAASRIEPLRLVVMPTGWLWTMPFAAIPLDGDGARLLVDGADLVLTPSLRFAAAAQERVRTADTTRAAVSWVDPDSGIAAAEIRGLDAYPDGHTALAAPEQVREAFVRGGSRWRTAVLAAHGNREPGLAQAAVARGRSVLAAADFLDGASSAPPAFVSLASCYSGYPDGDDPHEPLGLALAALAAGADHVLSAHFELDGRGSGALVRCLAGLYAEAADSHDIPALLCRQLRDPTIRARRPPEPLYRWAALAVVGSHPDD